MEGAVGLRDKCCLECPKVFQNGLRMEARGSSNTFGRIKNPVAKWQSLVI
jgi:hypothetical protein